METFSLMYFTMYRKNVISNIIGLLLFSFYDVLVGNKDFLKEIEIEGKIRLKTEFLDRLKDTMFIESKIVKSVKSLDRRFSELENESVNKLMDNIMESRKKKKNADREKSDISKYQQRVQTIGLESLTVVAEHLKSKLELSDAPVAAILDEVGTQYMSQLHSYFIFLTKKKPQHDIDKDFLVLDMVNIAHSLITSVEKTLLSRVLAIAKYTPKEDEQILTQTVYIYNMNNKKQEMQYICETMDICRPCPGFSDYFVKLLGETLKMHDVKFQYFILKSVQFLNNKHKFLETLLGNEIVEWFRAKTINVMDANVTDVREIISLLRSGISQRQRMISADDGPVKTKTKAVRILMDILDKALDNTGDDYFYIHLESAISNVQEWAVSKRNDIESILNTFLNQVVTSLQFDLPTIAKDEIKVLVDIIFYGSSVGNEDMEAYLLEKGSKYVKGFSPLGTHLFKLL